MSILQGKNIAILGGSGTLGRALVAEIVQNHSSINRLLIFSRDEIKQLEMMDEYSEKTYSFMKYMLGDVRDKDRLEQVLVDIDYVIHAAAIKHVVMAERNPGECKKTNIEGTKNVVDACLLNNVEQAILISTDKAVNPIGVYGKSKAKAEQLFLDSESTGTSFKIIRLGNIIGARGSVFEAFERQRKSGVIKVTHPEATRFCISQEDAVDNVLGMFMKPDTISIPYMESFSVMELAQKIAPECEIEIIGLRPGDKIHEELGDLSSNQSVQI